MLTFQMDVFTIEAVDMINLTKVMVGHEGEGHGKGWFLDKVIVKESTDAEQQYVFMCERYITKTFKTIITFPTKSNTSLRHYFYLY